MKFRMTYIITGILLLIILGCNSPEFTSLKMYVNENNLEKAEENGLLALEKEPENALVPYILAVDVYLEKKNYKDFAKMLDEAMLRNPDQKLERPFKIGNDPIITIGDAVKVYREQEWGTTYNEGVANFNDKDNLKAIENFELAAMIWPVKGMTYGTLSALYLEIGNVSKASEVIKDGLKYAPDDEQVNLAAATIAFELEDFDNAIKYYLIASKVSKNPGPIMRKLIFLYIDLGKYEDAIEYSLEALRSYPDDADIYYNMGVLYQKLALADFNTARENFLIISDMENPDQEKLKEIYQQFRSAKIYSIDAKEYFQQTLNLETEDTGAGEAVSEMKKMIRQMNEIFIPSVEKMMD